MVLSARRARRAQFRAKSVNARCADHPHFGWIPAGWRCDPKVSQIISARSCALSLAHRAKPTEISRFPATPDRNHAVLADSSHRVVRGRTLPGFLGAWRTLSVTAALVRRWPWIRRVWLPNRRRFGGITSRPFFCLGVPSINNLGARTALQTAHKKTAARDFLASAVGNSVVMWYNVFTRIETAAAATVRRFFFALAHPAGRTQGGTGVRQI